MTTASPGSGAQLALDVVRPVDAGHDAIMAVDRQDTGNVSAARVLTFNARIAVQAGDRLGMFIPGIDRVTSSSLVGDTGDIRQLGDVDIDPSVQPVSEFAANSHLEVSAVVEPDADHDEFGDVTQDACPTDPAKHVLPCAADRGVTLSVLPASVAAGGVALVTGTVTVVSGSARVGQQLVVVVQTMNPGRSRSAPRCPRPASTLPTTPRRRTSSRRRPTTPTVGMTTALVRGSGRRST